MRIIVVVEEVNGLVRLRLEVASKICDKGCCALIGTVNGGVWLTNDITGNGYVELITDAVNVQTLVELGLNTAGSRAWAETIRWVR